jgi:hypothetical protein
VAIVQKTFTASSAAAARIAIHLKDVRFSNRPFGVKHFQTIRRCGVDVTHGLVLFFGIGTRALPSWDSKTRWNNLLVGRQTNGRFKRSAEHERTPPSGRFQRQEGSS